MMWFVCAEFEAVQSAVTRPVVEPGELWTDPEFSCTVALPSIAGTILWQRPHVSRSD